MRRERVGLPLAIASLGTLASHVPLLSRRGLLAALATAAVGFAARPWVSPARSDSELDGQDLGELYHQWSKPSFNGTPTKPLEWGSQPPLYREYPGSSVVPLPQVGDFRGLTVEDAIQRRRSIRTYSGSSLPLDHLSQILHCASGITDPLGWLRASPSAGAQYPIEIYPIVHDVDQLAQGVYHYRPQDHALDMLKEVNLRTAMYAASGGQDQAQNANVVLVFTAVFQRTRWRYADRAYRYVMLDAGHMAENVYLQATSLQIGACAMGAFLDDDVNAIVGVDGQEEAAVHLLAIGTLE